MKKSHLLGIALACAYLFISTPASAATYSITFYEKVSVGLNLFDNFIVSGTGSFEINDAAVTPNNRVLFSDSNFLAFDAIITATGGSAQFTLGVDDFPPFGDGTSTVNTAVQGILFDASGQPLVIKGKSAIQHVTPLLGTRHLWFYLMKMVLILLF